jgi:hypothetical protein
MAPEAPQEANQEGVADGPLQTLEEAPSSPDESAAEAQARVLKYKGEELTVDDPRVIDLAQKGMSFEERMHQMRVDRNLFEQEKEQELSGIKELQEINDYAKQNPAFQHMLQQQWANIQAGNVPQVTPENQMQVMQSTINQLVDRLNSQEQQVSQRQNAEMQAAQEGAISQYKEEHPDFDWSKKDEFGLSLEDQIGQAMIDKRVADFRVMADSFLMKDLLERKSLEGKETVAKGIQKVNKLGLGKVTKKSTLASKKAEGVSNKSYDDLIKEGLSEYGIEY